VSTRFWNFAGISRSVMADDFAQAEESTHLIAGRSYPLWLPDRAYEVADVLMRELEAEKCSNRGHG
jgi:hypothetical protein